MSPAGHPGPFEARAGAKAAAAVLYAACPVPAGRAASAAILLDALSDAGVVIGGFDREVLPWLAVVASHEAVASLVGLIRRGHAGITLAPAQIAAASCEALDDALCWRLPGETGLGCGLCERTGSLCEGHQKDAALGAYREMITLLDCAVTP